jgi:hypothetical protein
MASLTLTTAAAPAAWAADRMGSAALPILGAQQNVRP